MTSAPLVGADRQSLQGWVSESDARVYKMPLAVRTIPVTIKKIVRVRPFSLETGNELPP